MKSRSTAKLSFEKALARLEALVAEIESGEIPLSDLVDRFAEGNRMLAICTEHLRAAEQKIELIKKERDSVAFEEFDPDQS